MTTDKQDRTPDCRTAGNGGIATLGRQALALAGLLTGLGQPVAGIAGEEMPGAAWMAERPASSGELAELRGGFMLANGMKLDFSLERLVTVDGVNRLNYSYHSPAEWAPGQWRNGSPSTAQPSPVTLIRNSLDNQVISSINRMDITLSNLRAMSAHGVAQGFQPYDTALLR